ncbi:aminotransferase class III-fold pyridoxal phosphate-dependent enzyme [Candidatus Woesearchaeota archaeon]|nr:aminotransferase class III-fold pyridoxal phosphate-dependent enzyme [Candidatus Woesearchaeota archaeon]
MKEQISVRTQIPGPKAAKILNTLQKKNGGWSTVYPFVHSETGEGSGCYFQDIDSNTFLDFGSQISSNPLGYNHPALLETAKDYLKRTPLKFAGQDFTVKEHLDMIEELLSIAPHSMHANAAFLINSGAEAVENAIKCAMRSRPATKLGISMTGAFHGRTLGALSCTNSKLVQKKGYLSIPMRRLSFSDNAGEELEKLLSREVAPAEVGFVIVEAIQGEGGYNIASQKMMRDLRKITKQQNIPFIADEVQSGMGRTGTWWAFEHFGIAPDFFTSAKALQVGAVVANKNWFPNESGAISSTWGGGHVLDLAMGITTIKTIKKHKLLQKNAEHGAYLRQALAELAQDSAGKFKTSLIQNIRGKGLMNAFDLPTKKMREDIVLQLLKQGIVVLGCGKTGIRLLPPYIVTKKEIDIFLEQLESALKICNKKGPVHTGPICSYGMCADMHT